MLDEITYALLNGKIKKLENNAGGVGKTKLSEFENDLFYNKETVLFSATKDDFQLANDGAESYYMANLSMNQGYSDDLKLENLELKIMTVSEEYQPRSFLLKLVEEVRDGIRGFDIYLPITDEFLGKLVPRAKMDQDFSPVYPVEDSAVLMIMPMVASVAESFTFIRKDIKKIPNEVVDLNEFIATYGVTTYAEILEATVLDKKCYILDSETMTKVPVTSISEDGIIGNLETFNSNGLQPEMLVILVNSTNEWFKEKIVMQSAYNMTSDIEDTTPESYPSTEAVRNALQKVLPIIDLQSVPGTDEDPRFLGEEQAKAVQEAIAAEQSIIGIHYMSMLDGTMMPGPTVFAPAFSERTLIGQRGAMMLVLVSDPESERVAFIGMDTSPLGDIDAALDAILAIQNELIGGEGE